MATLVNGLCSMTLSGKSSAKIFVIAGIKHEPPVRMTESIDPGSRSFFSNKKPTASLNFSSCELIYFSNSILVISVAMSSSGISSLADSCKDSAILRSRKC